MKIALIRHGRPDIEAKAMIHHKSFNEWLMKYDKAVIDKNFPVADSLLEKIKDCQLFVCSDLGRSISSFELLGFAGGAIVDPFFRECEVPYSKRVNFYCRADILTVIYRVLWLMGFSANCESKAEATARANLCAEKLIAFASEYGFVSFVGHGFLNRFIAAALVERGWSGPKQPGKKHWSCDVYEIAN
ncbi:MAG: hypothetical protein B0W54_21460 [Cellvibrio sp. 79]|nr:MAG: hypothetical protein B0W54_21460 [Cellvibrio sp. 79]